MPDSAIRLRGDRDVIAAMRYLREYLPKTVLRQALRKAAQYLLGYVVLVAPKATGKLARNIVIKFKRTNKTLRAGVSVNTRGKADDPQNAFYWRFLEEGFHTRSGEYKQLPFIRGVFDHKSHEAAQMVSDSVEKTIATAERKFRRSF
jgi:HK97 gp10 family phage protein